MQESRGAFIVIEGSDGSGKATQLALIKERLEAAGYEVETFDFPQYDQPSSYFVRRYLEGGYGSADDVGPYTSSLFYALDRFEAAPRIREALAAGKVVVSNRFTGSNMAHQGTKIPNAEQRRGFFIWLDNLEFEMLRIPRPDVSFILRVPADISEELLLKTGKKKDIHEIDRLHLARAVLVFDDMAQLFPKDFQRIDCVRSGELLDVPTINTMLWEKISPMLPPPPAKKNPQPIAAQPVAVEAAPAQELKEIEQKEEIPAAPAPTEELVVTDASGLLIQRIERITRARIEHPEKPQLYQPGNLVPVAQKAYEEKSNALLGLHAKIVAGLNKKAGMDTAEAMAAAAPALMVAASATAHVSVDDPALEELVVSLLNDQLPELQAAGANLFAQAIKHNPARFKGADKPVSRRAPATISAIAEEFLAENHIGEQPPVQLVAAWPRNENDLIADMLYAHTGLPLRTIQERIAGWPMNRKLEIFEAYVSDTQAGPVLERAHYSWDIRSPYSTFRELQRLPSEALEIQTLTPRHGYDIPKAIEDAGLSDTYEKCFDLSLALYSDLQQAGHHLEAQYTTLNGHNQRWKMTQNASQFVRPRATSQDTEKLLAQMREKLSEIHPGIAEATGRE